MADSTLISTSAEDRALDALVSVIQSTASPAAAEAQTLLLRRLALEGDVIPSRIPAPLNITEVGGYFNLLETLNQRQAMVDVIASALGLASSSARGLTRGDAPLTFSAVANDQAAGAAIGTAPATVLVRADLVASLNAVLTQVHTFGAVLPLYTAPLPPSLSSASDALEAIGRSLRLLPTAALTDPATDSLLLMREAQAGATSFSVFARPDSANPLTATLPEINAEAIQIDGSGAVAVVDAGTIRLVDVTAIAAPHGWICTPVPQPTSRNDLAWTRLVNVAGLLPGITRLRDELRLLHAADQIANSPFSTQLDWLWNGAAFAPA
ncbi:MAG: hypothetical protein LBE59_04065 [Nevskiaceae bacterium]|jgi:hypothetical protein|nr:hypothetical protein [Nevskiaceae bacterium]